jgi:hypothetical protein
MPKFLLSPMQPIISCVSTPHTKLSARYGASKWVYGQKHKNAEL